MIRLRHAALAALAFLTLLPAAAQAAPGEAKRLFADDGVIRVTIKAPIGQIVAARVRSDVPVDGTLTPAGEAALPIKLSVRGLTRRKTDACMFPPLRVEFTEKPAAGSLFQGQKKLKLVTHCRSSESFQKYLLTEYSAYKLYNVMTPLSFRVRLARVDYVEADGKPIVSRLGFFIEDADDMAKRNGLAEAEVGDRVNLSTLIPADGARAAMFEMMVGNLDWAMHAGPAGAGCCHNFRLIAPKDATKGYTPVPYDFDFSGLVDAPYALPPDSIQVPSVRTRRYRGLCIHNAAALTAAADFRAKRAALLAVYDQIPEMDADARAKARAYLTPFFDMIATDKDVDTKLLKACVS